MAASPLVVSRPAGWRQSRWLAVAEFLLVAFIFFADARHWIPLSKTPVLVLLGWISLRVRGQRWRSVGLMRPQSWLRTLAWGLAGGVAIEAIELFISQPLLVRITGHPPDLSDFNGLRGNPTLLLIGLAFTWTLAAFGEEMAWRGYLMNRIAGLFSNPRVAWTVALIAANIAFGFAHAYQGVTGIIDEGFMGLLLAFIYLGARRNLYVPIVAHGTQDTIDLVLLFLGHYPGV